MNHIDLIGRVTKDIELRKTQNGKSVATFTVAVDRIPEGADFPECVAWGKEAENISKYVRKGHRIGISGHLQTRSYKDRDGKTVYKTEVIVDHADFLEPKKSEPADSGLSAPAFTPLEEEEGDLPF